MTKVYDQHDAAFRNVSAFAILKDGKHVANITLKHGGRVSAYVHWIGIEMTRGSAGGGGYDRASAAIANAACKIAPADLRIEDSMADCSGFKLALNDGHTSAGWSNNLRAAGFTIANVIG